MLLDKTPLYPQRGSNTQPSEWRVDALTSAPWQIISFGFVKWRVECLRSIFWYSNLHNTPDRFRTCCQKNHMWPGRDLNTQPSKLESDALPIAPPSQLSMVKNCYSSILEILTRLRRFWMTCVRALKRAWNFEGNRSWGEYLYVLTCYWTKRPYTPSVVRTPIPRNRGWTLYPLCHDRS